MGVVSFSEGCVCYFFLPEKVTPFSTQIGMLIKRLLIKMSLVYVEAIYSGFKGKEVFAKFRLVSQGNLILLKF